jgi:hypothetical protein
MIPVVVLALLVAQDPFQVAPDDYKLEFENEYVRIVRVTYGPHQKSPEHDHPGSPTVYVYTTDGAPMKISHNGEEPIIRPAVRAGQIRFSRGMPEHHTMENLGDTKSEYIRVELKTKPIDLPQVDVRLAPNAPSYESRMIGISRVVGSGESLPPETNPAVYVVLETSKASFVPASLAVFLEAGAHAVKIELKSDPK